MGNAREERKRILTKQVCDLSGDEIECLSDVDISVMMTKDMKVLLRRVWLVHFYLEDMTRDCMRDRKKMSEEKLALKIANDRWLVKERESAVRNYLELEASHPLKLEPDPLKERTRRMNRYMRDVDVSDVYLWTEMNRRTKALYQVTEEEEKKQKEREENELKESLRKDYLVMMVGRSPWQKIDFDKMVSYLANISREGDFSWHVRKSLVHDMIREEEMKREEREMKEWRDIVNKDYLELEAQSDGDVKWESQRGKYRPQSCKERDAMSDEELYAAYGKESAWLQISVERETRAREREREESVREEKARREKEENEKKMEKGVELEKVVEYVLMTLDKKFAEPLAKEEKKEIAKTKRTVAHGAKREGREAIAIAKKEATKERRTIKRKVARKEKKTLTEEEKKEIAKTKRAAAHEAKREGREAIAIAKKEATKERRMAMRNAAKEARKEVAIAKKAATKKRRETKKGKTE